jgi:hypothetical protein
MNGPFKKEAGGLGEGNACRGAFYYNRRAADTGAEVRR